MAQIADVSVENKDINVHRVVCAIDCGPVVNPLTVEAQMQSGIVFGLSAALHGQITLKSGSVEQGSLNRLVLTARDPLGDGGTTTPPPPFRRPGLRRSA